MFVGLFTVDSFHFLSYTPAMVLDSVHPIFLNPSTDLEVYCFALENCLGLLFLSFFLGVPFEIWGIACTSRVVKSSPL